VHVHHLQVPTRHGLLASAMPLLSNTAHSHHTIKLVSLKRRYPTDHDAHMAHQLASHSFHHGCSRTGALARAWRDDIMGYMGLDETWIPGKNMHALPIVDGPEDKSHNLRSWSKAVASRNTARPHHTATPPALAHPRSTTRTAPRKTTTTQPYYTPRGSTCAPSTNGVAAQGWSCAFGVMI
jgi:hypothetical protein